MQELETQLNAILEAAEKDGVDNLQLHALLQKQRRVRAHSKAKESQPDLGIRQKGAKKVVADAAVDKPFAALRDFFRAPITQEDSDASPGALDQLLLTVQDSIDAGDFDDAVFAMARVCRKAWAWNIAHLGPIEGMAAAKAAVDTTLRHQIR